MSSYLPCTYLYNISARKNIDTVRTRRRYWASSVVQICAQKARKRIQNHFLTHSVEHLKIWNSKSSNFCLNFSFNFQAPDNFRFLPEGFPTYIEERERERERERSEKELGDANVVISFYFYCETQKVKYSKWKMKRFSSKKDRKWRENENEILLFPKENWANVWSQDITQMWL